MGKGIGGAQKTVNLSPGSESNPRGWGIGCVVTKAVVGDDVIEMAT